MNEQATGAAALESDAVQDGANATSDNLRPSTSGEIDQVHTWLMEAISSSPYYNDTFKTFEKARLTKGYLHSLHAIDPAHIMVMTSNNKPVGFMISGPEYGTLWLYWSYLIPERRRSNLAMSSVRAFVKHWDNGRFHKVATYTKHGNRPAEAVMKRLGFKHICTLEKHIFGEDYLLYEYALTKVTEGYDNGMGGTKTAWGKQLVKKILGLSG